MNDVTGTSSSGTGGALYKFLAGMQGVMPMGLYMWIAKTMMTPQQLAHVLSHLPPEPLPDIVPRLPMTLNASVAALLTDVDVKKLVDVLPIELLVDVSRALAEVKDYKTMAKFGEMMAPSRVKALVVMQNDPESMAHSAQYFDSVTLARIADGFSGSYVKRLAAALDRLGYHDVEAELGQFMADDHLLGLVKGLEPLQSARFLSCVEAGRRSDLLNRLNEGHRVPIEHELQQGVGSWSGSLEDFPRS